MVKWESDRVMVICKAGANHNGSLEQALTLVDAAASAGADVVKFQTFRAESLVTATVPKADYQERNAPEYLNQLEMLKALELDAESHKALRKRAEEKEIKFL